MDAPAGARTAGLVDAVVEAELMRFPDAELAKRLIASLSEFVRLAESTAGE